MEERVGEENISGRLQFLESTSVTLILRLKSLLEDARPT